MPTPLLDNRQLGTDTARRNLLANGGFEIWQRGTASVAIGNGVFLADRWHGGLVGTGAGTWAQDTTNVDVGSGAALAATITVTTAAPLTNGMGVMQKLEDFKQLRGKQLTFSIRLKANSGTPNVQLTYFDGAWNLGPVTPISTTYTTYTYTFTPQASASSVYVGLWFETNATFYLDNATLVVGSQAADYAPMHPADDLNRCLRYYQRWSRLSAAYLPGTGSSVSTTQALTIMPYQAPFPLTPSFTISAGTHWNVVNATFSAGTACTAFGVQSALLECMLLVGTVASGLTAGAVASVQSNNNLAWMAMEYNP